MSIIGFCRQLSVFGLVALFAQLSTAESTHATASLSRRIVGGSTIGTSGFDFIIGFVPKTPRPSVKGCTGVLIAPKFVLTTQACIDDGSGNDNSSGKLVLAVGTTDGSTGKKKFRNFTVVKTYSDTTFPPVGYYNHIALMELDKEVPESVARPVKIFASDQTNDIPAVLVGYAANSTQTSAISLTDMRQWAVSLDSPEYCQDALDNINGKTELCSRTTAGLNTCAVDYGTPLLTKYEIPILSSESDGKATGTQTGYALLGLTTFAYHNADYLMSCVYGSQIGFYTWIYPFIQDIASATGIDKSELIVSNLTTTQGTLSSSSSSSSANSSTSSSSEEDEASTSSEETSSDDVDEDEGNGVGLGENDDTNGWSVDQNGPISPMVFEPKKSAAVKAYGVFDPKAIAALSVAAIAALAGFI
ncbi:hypothetical protein H4R99_000438 [Coemansia sp. RSA 1722]|nr:hypothetical protein IWW45_001816 [Coemansia sp. RSA 485]KAJ2606417.1 hypothetical protein H4R99_000438 [Coemansia sp. RSA 1722]